MDGRPGNLLGMCMPVFCLFFSVLTHLFFTLLAKADFVEECYSLIESMKNWISSSSQLSFVRQNELSHENGLLVCIPFVILFLLEY